MKSNAIRWIPVLAVSGLFLGCSEDALIEPEEKIKPGGGNHLPVIVLQLDTFAIVGDTLRLEFSATDEDGDILSFEEKMPCTWGEIRDGRCHPPIAQIDSRTGSFWFYPRTYDIPSRSATVTVSDGRGGYASTNFDISVSMGP